MGGRAKKQVPAPLSLKYNFSTGFYEEKEGDISYLLTFEQVNHLKNYFHLLNSGYEPRVSTWYKSLPKAERSKVRMTGAPAEPEDFYPDPEYPD